MPHPAFYNDNMYRRYPFAPGPDAVPALPTTAVVDFGCAVGLDADYDDYQDTVYLRRLGRVGDTFTFRFASTAPGLADVYLDFRHRVDDGLWTLEDADAAEVADGVVASEDSTSSCFLDSVRWEGWLVTGDMARLAGLVADGVTLDFGVADYAVEPALVQNLGGGYVRTINVANAERTKYLPDMAYGCSLSADGYLADYDPDRYYVGRV